MNQVKHVAKTFFAGTKKKKTNVYAKSIILSSQEKKKRVSIATNWRNTGAKPTWKNSFAYRPLAKFVSGFGGTWRIFWGGVVLNLGTLGAEKRAEDLGPSHQ